MRKIERPEGMEQIESCRKGGGRTEWWKGGKGISQ